MKRIAIPIVTENLCSYGCGCVAKFKNGSGRIMCDISFNRCPALRKKNSDGLKKAYREGRKNCDHFDGKRNWSKGATAYTDKRIVGKYSPDELFVKSDKTIRGPRKKIIIQERGHQCEKCKNTEWLGEPITLEMDHVDGDRKNNLKSNLKLLCPNCHSKTKTWRKPKHRGGVANKRHTDEEIIVAVKSSENLLQALDKLDLRWGSGGTILNVMSRHRINFMGS